MKRNKIICKSYIFSNQLISFYPTSAFCRKKLSADVNLLLLIILLAICSLPMNAALRLPNIFTDHMVLQQHIPAKIWGWADKKTKVSICLNGRTVTTSAGKDGRWQAILPAMNAGGPYLLTVKSSKESITVSDIMIGEVWICSGQSNMEMRLNQVNNSVEETAGADYPLIRTFNVAKAVSTSPLQDVKGKWQVCTPETACNFSAVGYFFARNIMQHINVPIGIINASWGGTDIEGWMSMEAIDKFPKYKRLMNIMRTEDIESYKARSKAIDSVFQCAVKTERGIAERWHETSFCKSDWKRLSVPGLWTDEELAGTDGVVWTTTCIYIPDSLAGKTARLHLGKIDDADVTFINGTQIGATNDYNTLRDYTVPKGLLKGGSNELTVKIIDNHGVGGCYGSESLYYIQIGETRLPILDNEWKYRISLDHEAAEYVGDAPNAFPSRLYNAMVAPIKGYAAKGFLWYQGENNATRAEEYYRLFPALITDWRKQWKNDNMPFYWVQLANYRLADGHQANSKWAVIRDAQNATLALPHTGQAVIIDAGEAGNIHPCDKQTVGHRLARIALHNDYGFKNIYCDSPQPVMARLHSDFIEVSFKYVASGLKVDNPYGYIYGFAVAGCNGRFKPAKAEFSAPDRIRIAIPKGMAPAKIRYAWADNPEDANVCNSENLPATPFVLNIE